MLTVSQSLTHGNSTSKCCEQSNFMEKFPSRAAASCQYWPFTVKGFKNNFIEPAVCRAEGPHSVSNPQGQLPSLLQQGVPAWESGVGPAPASAPSSALFKIWWAGSRVTRTAPGDFARSTLESAQMNYSVSTARCEMLLLLGGDTAGQGNLHRAQGHCPQKLFLIKSQPGPTWKNPNKHKIPQPTNPPPKNMLEKTIHAKALCFPGLRFSPFFIPAQWYQFQKQSRDACGVPAGVRKGPKEFSHLKK